MKYKTNPKNLYSKTINKTLENLDFNDFLKFYKNYCKGMKIEIDNRYFTIIRSGSIIFEVDLDKIDFSITSDNTVILPNMISFIEINSWFIKKDKWTIVNCGGIHITEIKNGESWVNTLWIMVDNNGKTRFRNIEFSIDPNKINENSDNILKRHGIAAESVMDKDMIKFLIEKIQKIIYFVLVKINNKEYTKYKKWETNRFIEKDIVYSNNFSKHKRHFWKDSGRFKIPLMKKEEWESLGYGTDEVVFRDGQLRKNVPYKIIGENFIERIRNKKENNKRIKLTKGRVLRQEEKVYNILREIFPNNIIRRHDRRTLKGLELDFNLPEFRLGVEYDGEQHYDRKLCEEVFKSNFDEQVRRDRKKDKLCIKKNIKLIRIRYDEPLTKTNLKKKLKEAGVNYGSI